MKVKGIKRGQTIELLEEINIQERLTRLNQLFGAWKNQPALDEIFADIDTERHAYRGRAIESIDN